MRIKIRKNSDAEKLTSLIVLVIFCLFVTNIALGLEGTIGIPQSIISFYLKIILGCGFLFCLPVFFRRISIRQILILLGIIILFCMQVILFPEVNHVFYDVISYFIINCLSISMVVAFLNKEEYFLLEKKIRYCAYIISILILIVMFLPMMGANTDFQLKSYAMGLGYACLIPCLILLNNAIKLHSKKDLFFFIVILLFLISYGSRGPLLGIILFFLYQTIFNIKNKNIFLFLLLVSAAVIIYCNYSSVLSLLSLVSNFLYENFGIRSRTLILLIEDNIYQDSGRNVLYQKIWDSIVQNPFAVHGIASDRLLLGIYPHNIILELLYQGGIIFFLIIVIFLIICTIITFTHVKDQMGTMCVIFFFSSIPGLMISGSFWNVYSFWIWIVVCLNKEEYWSPKRNRSNSYV